MKDSLVSARRSWSLAIQRFRVTQVTENKHPYINAWWPLGQTIGWEHTFIHEIADLLVAINTRKPVVADFYDDWRCQQVLDAVIEYADNGCGSKSRASKSF